MLCTAENLKYIAKILRIGSYSERLPIPGYGLEECESKLERSQSRSGGTSVLRSYFYVPPPCDIHIACQAER